MLTPQQPQGYHLREGQSCIGLAEESQDRVVRDRGRGGREHQYLHHHLHHKDGCEDVVGDAEKGPFLQGKTSGKSMSTSPCPTQRASCLRGLTVLPGSMSGLSRAMVIQLRKMKTRTTWSNILCAMTFWQETRSLRRQPR